MKEIYQYKINNMIQNYETLKKPFRWENDMVRHLVALSYAIQEKPIDPHKISEMKEYIKSKTGAFSAFRGHMLFALSGMLCATSHNPEERFDNMLANKDTLRGIGFKNSSYLPTALYALSSMHEGTDIAGYGRKAMDIYREMKRNHPFLTSGDDYALAILLAGTDHSPRLLEEYYNALHDRGFTKSNGLQMLSHIMAFSNKEVRESSDQCRYVYTTLKQHGLKAYATYYPAIGLISLLKGNEAELTTDLIEVASYLREQKKYKWLGKGMNLLIASAIITSEYIKENSGDVVKTALSVSIHAIIAAQQAAMIAAVSASTAVAVSN